MRIDYVLYKRDRVYPDTITAVSKASLTAQGIAICGLTKGTNLEDRQVAEALLQVVRKMI